MKLYRFSINFDYFNRYTFGSGNAGFYHDFYFKSARLATRHLKKVIDKEYPADKYNIKNVTPAYYIMTIKIDGKQLERHFKQWLVFYSPMENILFFIFHHTREESVIYKTARRFLRWSISF